MNCQNVENRISSYIDGELTGREMILVRDHVSQCAMCAEEMEILLQTKQMLGSLAAPPVAPDFEDRLLRTVRLATQTQVPLWSRLGTYFRGNVLNLAVGAAGIYVALMILVTPERGDFFTKGNGNPTSSSVGFGAPLDPDFGTFQQIHDPRGVQPTLYDNYENGLPLDQYQRFQPVNVDNNKR